jgi:hypothetical protein
MKRNIADTILFSNEGLLVLSGYRWTALIMNRPSPDKGEAGEGKLRPLFPIEIQGCFGYVVLTDHVYTFVSEEGDHIDFAIGFGEAVVRVTKRT